EAYSLIRFNGGEYYTTKDILPENYHELPGIAVELRGATKDFGMAGARIAQILTFDSFKNKNGVDMTIAEAMAEMQGKSISQASRFAQKAYGAAYQQWRETLTENKAFYEPRVNAVFDVLSKAGLTKAPRPKGSIYAVLDD